MDTLLAVLFFLLPFLAVLFFLVFIDLAIRHGTGAGYEPPDRPTSYPLEQSSGWQDVGVVIRVRRQRRRQ